MPITEQYFEVLRKFADEHKNEPGLLKGIGVLITDGSLAESLKRTANKTLESTQADVREN